MKSISVKFLVIALATVLVLVALALTLDSSSSTPTTDVVAMVRDIERGAVKELKISRNGKSATIAYIDSSRPPETVAIPAGTTLPELLTNAEIPVGDWPAMPVAPESATSRFSTFARFGLIILFVGAIVFLLRRSSGGFGGTSSRKGAFEPVRPGERPVLFSDVAGSEEIKEEIGDVVDFLRDADRFHQIGARIPRGVLLVGPPGTGKTLLARAVAGEARASFFSVSGSEFVEMYVGVGASRVRELFKKARECAPSIIFIDEIDAIGRRRGRAEHSSEYDQTLNQILVEMDGFEQRSTVIVLAATNRVDILDPALLRPGRFDRKIHVDLPDRAARSAILRVHARGKPLDEGVDLEELAARTSGLSGADLANLMNEAAILTARRGGTTIGAAELMESIDRAVAGPARASGRFSERERRIIAWHEAGHALVAHALPNADPVRKVSIVARGRAGGYTLIIPDDDRGLWTRGQLIDRLAALLGGYAAEELVFGDVTTGSSNDLEQASSMTLSMVARYGMGRAFGLFALGHEDGSTGVPSQRTAFAAESEARSLVEDAYEVARQILFKRRSQLDALARRLLDVETLDHQDMVAMFGPAAAPPTSEPVGTSAAAGVPLRVPAPVRGPGRHSRRERLVHLPAAIVASFRLGRRRRVIE